MPTALTDPQSRFDVAVAIPTVLRPTLARAVQSVFRQQGVGRIQILLGIDRREGDPGVLDALARACPAHVHITVIDPGYSTARRHGGLYPCAFGGALRTILSYAANSQHVAYLDDDDWWQRNHLASLLAAVAGKHWAFSYRWFTDRDTGWPICRDEWDAVGPGRGINAERFGGFVAPSTLLLDKAACHMVLPYWSLAPAPDGGGEDRLVFEQLRKHPDWAATGEYTCHYEIPREVQRHRHHAREFAARNIGWMGDPVQIQAIARATDDAAAALALGDAVAARAACRRALAVHPHHAPALHLLAQAERQAGAPAAARTHLAEAVAADDRDPALLAAWADANGDGGPAPWSK